MLFSLTAFTKRLLHDWVRKTTSNIVAQDRTIKSAQGCIESADSAKYLLKNDILIKKYLYLQNQTILMVRLRLSNKNL